jgi:hypothetical protein
MPGFLPARHQAEAWRKCVFALSLAADSAPPSAIGKGDVFTKGRDFSAWLGIVPKQTATGGRPILGRISKRGNRYLRQLFVQAARIVALRLKTGIVTASIIGPRQRHAGCTTTSSPCTRQQACRIAWAVLHSRGTFATLKKDAYAATIACRPVSTALCARHPE